MSIHRYAARRDQNEAELLVGLRKIAQVYQLNKPCDLLVRFRDRVHILEVDNPLSKYRKREQGQLDFLREWHVPIVQTLDDAFNAIGALRNG